MSEIQLAYPVLVQVVLTFALLVGTGHSRVNAVRGGLVHVRDIALGQQAWPEQPTKFANAYRNQFELPVLFYVLVILLMLTKVANLFDVVLAWLFVGSRLVHAYIHVTTNKVIHRFRAFVVGVCLLGAMWVLFAIRLLTTGVS